MNERVIFDAAVEIADAQARRVFIEKACAGNPGLLVAVDTLLKSYDMAGSFLNVPVGEQVRPAVASGIDSGGANMSSPAFDKTRHFPSGTSSDEDSDDESQPDLSFLQPSSKPGSIGLLGHYEILQVLGQGGFGIVLKAFDEKLHRLVAVKVMNPQMAASSPPRKRFLREARAAAAIRHENIVQVYSVEEQPLPYLVMEYIDGQTLQQKQKDHGPLEVAELLHIGRQIASGLAAAQAMGLIHRDIKPGNVLIEQGAEQKVKITDFGLARAADDASLTRSGTISGTPMYMAPEQVLGQPLDHRADLFSLGSVLYELATGRPPFRATNTIAVLRRVTEDTPRPMQEIIPEIPEWLVAIVTQLHAKKPEDRFQTAKEVADLLARCQAELQLKGEVTYVPPNVEHASSVPLREGEAPAEPRASVVARPESSKGVVSEQQTMPFTKRQGVPRKRTARLIVLSPLLAMLVLTPILFGRHFSSAFNKWLWPAIPTLPPTQVNTGLQFDGKDDYVKVGPIDLSSPQYTLEAFVTSSGDGDNGVIVLLNNVEKEPELIYLYDGYPGKERKSGAGIVGQRPYQSVNAPLPSGTREHRALVVDGQVMHYFVNGIRQGKCYCTARKGLMWEMRELHLGCMANQTQFFRGQIDQLRLSKIARYNNNFTVASKLTSDDSTLALYNFDEGRGDVLNDSSGHGHHGKIVGATWASPNSSSNSLSPAESIADRRAAEWVLSISGNIAIDENGEGREINAGRDLPDGAIVLNGVVLKENQKVSDAGLAHLKGCKYLTHINLHRTKVTDAGLVHFRDCKSLSRLWLSATQVTDAGLAHFKDHNLTLLDLSETKVSDTGLIHFKDCKNLVTIQLNDTQVSDAGLAHFKDRKNLTILGLSNVKLSDAGLAYFKDCRNLNLLWMDGTQVTDAGLADLAACPKLELVSVKNSKVTETGVKKLSAALPGCKIEWDGGVIEPTVSPDRRAAEYVLSIGGRITINENGQGRKLGAVGELPQGAFELTDAILVGNQMVSDGGLAEFKDCKNLTFLGLQRTKVTDTGLANFKHCKKLVILILTDTQVSDTGLAHFQDCTNLTALELNGAQVGDAGLANFQDCTKLTRLLLDRTRVSDRGLAHFKNCKNLAVLSLNRTGVSDAGLTHFQDCKNLAYVDLSGTQVSDAGLAHFQSCKDLLHFVLQNTNLSNAGLERLAQMSQLISANVKQTKVTEAGVKKLSAVLPGCKIEWDGGVIEPRSAPVPALLTAEQRRALVWLLNHKGDASCNFDNLYHWSLKPSTLPEGPAEFVNLVLTEFELTDETHRELAALPKFSRGLNVTHSPKIQDAEFARILELPILRDISEVSAYDLGITDASLPVLQRFRLKHLGLASVAITNRGFEIVAGFPLNRLDLSECRELTGECFKTVGKIRSLTELHVQNMAVHDSDLAALASLNQLSGLTVSGTPITDLGLDHLGKMKAIKSLDLKRTKVTEAGVKKLSAALPGCKIEWGGGVIESKPTIDPDRRAAEWVLSVGGRVRLKDQAGEIAAINDLPTQAFQLDHINLHGCTKVTEAGFMLLKECQQVTSLHLMGARFDESWLEHFDHFKDLGKLNLGFTNVTDAALAHFKDCTKLTYLDLTHVPVGDVGLLHLKDCRELVDVILDGTRVTDDGLAHLKNCRKLTGLNVMNTRVGDAGMAHFKDFELTNLFAGASRVTDAGLANFGRCERLEWLDLRDLPVTDTGLANFKEAKSLAQLNLTNTKAGNGTLQMLQPSRQLVHAQLGGTQVNDEGLAHLKECKNLLALNLNATSVSDGGLDALTELRRLGELDLRKTKVTEVGVKKLSAALPGCKIEWDGGVIGPKISDN